MHFKQKDHQFLFDQLATQIRVIDSHATNSALQAEEAERRAEQAE